MIKVPTALRRWARAGKFFASAVPTGAAGFVWTIASTVVNVLLSLTRFAPYSFYGSVRIARPLAGLERRRVAALTGRAIASPYRQRSGGIRAQGIGMFRERASWRDATWLALSFPLALAGLIPLIVDVVALALVLAPAWVWAVPSRHPPAAVAFFFGNWPGRFGATVVGLLLLPAAVRLTTAAAEGAAELTGSLLGAGSQQRLAARADQLVATRARVLDAQAAELRRIERDLHDGAQARIVAAGMTLALVDRRLRSGEPVIDDIDSARTQLNKALLELRLLIRGIHPPILTDRGLYAALSALAADNPLDVTIRVDNESRLPPAVESAAYFMVAETLTNAAKHANAQHVLVELRTTSDHLLLQVSDDGSGGAAPSGGSGLDGIRRRAEALDGTLTLESPFGGPTVIRAELPCAS